MTHHRYLTITLFTILWTLFLNAEPVGFAGGNEHAAYTPVDLSKTEALLLNDVLEEVKQYRLDDALQNLQKLTQDHPTFKLAQLIYADLLMARMRVIRGFGHLSKQPSGELSGLLDEARMRWKHYLERPAADAIPANIMRLNTAVRHAILVDLNSSRLYLFENQEGIPALLKDYYISFGKNGAPKHTTGDQRTPVGVYFVTDHLSGKGLPDQYGIGAFPLNYPNEWDERLGKTGKGIWLHGTSFDTYSRPPRSSDGCVTLSNADFSEITPYIDIDQTPVVITDRTIAWLDTLQWEQQRASVAGLIESWRQDWESRDADRYLSHYSKTFSTQGKNYAAWRRYKRRVNTSKTFIKVSLSDISLYVTLGEQDMLVATFQQDYESDDYREQSKKRQYWKREADGEWRIVYEIPM